MPKAKQLFIHENARQHQAANPVYRSSATQKAKHPASAWLRVFGFRVRAPDHKLKTVRAWGHSFCGPLAEGRFGRPPRPCFPRTGRLHAEKVEGAACWVLGFPGLGFRLWGLGVRHIKSKALFAINTTTVKTLTSAADEHLHPHQYD